MNVLNRGAARAPPRDARVVNDNHLTYESSTRCAQRAISGWWRRARRRCRYKCARYRLGRHARLLIASRIAYFALHRGRQRLNIKAGRTPSTPRVIVDFVFRIDFAASRAAR